MAIELGVSKPMVAESIEVPTANIYFQKILELNDICACIEKKISFISVNEEINEHSEPAEKTELENKLDNLIYRLARLNESIVIHR